MGWLPMGPGTWPLDHPNLWTQSWYEPTEGRGGVRLPQDRLRGASRGVTKSPKRKRR